MTLTASCCQRVAPATKLVPATLGAVIGERAFGALLRVRVTALLDPKRAVDIASHLPVTFLADLSLHLDPRRASRVIGEMPPATVAAIATELVASEEYIVMGGFVGHLSRAALLAALDVVDGESLLRTAYVSAAQEEELWPALIAFAAELADDEHPTIGFDDLVSIELRAVAGVSCIPTEGPLIHGGCRRDCSTRLTEDVRAPAQRRAPTITSSGRAPGVAESGPAE